MKSMGELAFIAVVTVSESGELFAHLSFILKGISFEVVREIVWIISFLAAVTFGG